jgi:hypothetical protein
MIRCRTGVAAGLAGSAELVTSLLLHIVAWGGLTVLHRLHRQPSTRRASGLFLLVAT